MVLEPAAGALTESEIKVTLPVVLTFRFVNVLVLMFWRVCCAVLDIGVRADAATV